MMQFHSENGAILVMFSLILLLGSSSQEGQTISTLPKISLDTSFYDTVTQQKMTLEDVKSHYLYIYVANADSGALMVAPFQQFYPCFNQTELQFLAILTDVNDFSLNNESMHDLALRHQIKWLWTLSYNDTFWNQLRTQEGYWICQILIDLEKDETIYFTGSESDPKELYEFIKTLDITITAIPAMYDSYATIVTTEYTTKINGNHITVTERITSLITVEKDIPGFLVLIPISTLTVLKWRKKD